MLEGVEKVGLKHMAMWENGFRNYTNNAHPIESPADCKGQKIRTMENPIHMKAWKEIGANPTPMAFSELFTAMQQGTVDGEENPIGIISQQPVLRGSEIYFFDSACLYAVCGCYES